MSTGECRKPHEVMAIEPTSTSTISIEPMPIPSVGSFVPTVIPTDRFQPSTPAVGQVIVAFHGEGGQGPDFQAREVHVHADGRVLRPRLISLFISP